MDDRIEKESDIPVTDDAKSFMTGVMEVITKSVLQNAVTAMETGLDVGGGGDTSGTESVGARKTINIRHVAAGIEGNEELKQIIATSTKKRKLDEDYRAKSTDLPHKIFHRRLYLAYSHNHRSEAHLFYFLIHSNFFYFIKWWH